MVNWVEAKICRDLFFSNARESRDAYLVDKQKVKPVTAEDKKYNASLKKIANSERRKYTFKYVSTYLGRGPNKPLSKVIKYDSEDNVLEIG